MKLADLLQSISRVLMQSSYQYALPVRGFESAVDFLTALSDRVSPCGQSSLFRVKMRMWDLCSMYEPRCFCLRLLFGPAFVCFLSNSSPVLAQTWSSCGPVLVPGSVQSSYKPVLLDF